MIEDPVIKSWAIAAQSTRAMLFHVPTENMRRIFRYIEALRADRDRMREALEQFLIEYDVVDLADAEPSSLTEAVLDARAALKGETP